MSMNCQFTTVLILIDNVTTKSYEELEPTRTEQLGLRPNNPFL